MPRKKLEAPKPVKILKKIKTPSLLRGFKDILPSEQKYWWQIFDKARDLARDYSYEKIESPILEDVKLFYHSVGKETDVANKEMYVFKDRDGEEICLRPEATASIARSYINHGMLNLPQPVKMWYFGPMFRHDRPQSGRYRQFYQIGYEAIGDNHPVLDAQLIILAYNFFKELGVETVIQINSIGCRSCRNEYKKNLVNYYKTQKRDLCPDCKDRLVKNPLRLLDCKEDKCRMIREDAPQILDWICEECKTHFFRVLEFLDEVGVPYELNPYLVRGLDYYTKTVFEILPKETAVKTAEGGAPIENNENKDNTEAKLPKAQNALGGGGRYDDLIESLGGRPTPAAGFAIGAERAIIKIKEAGTTVPEERYADIMMAQLGEQAKRKAMVLYEKMRAEGFKVAECFAKDGLKNQLEIANRLGVKYTLILGQKELSEGTIIIREMDGGSQEIVAYDKAIKEIKKRLELN